ncbi:MAG: fumarate hydrolyase [Deltaproteobacteria bacterium]|nr:MAG: fumarate hydrolyase [Deltaproteobacteria bacterium]
MKNIALPIDEKGIRELQVGDEVSISGVMITARDAAHKYMVEQDAVEVRRYLEGGMIYHCGPVVGKNDDGSWRFVAAGPTTSKREEPYQGTVIERYGVRGVIGKGGMGPATLEAMKKYGAVYLHAIGGLAVLLARSVKRVIEVHKLDEFGPPEAMWVIEVEDFPAIVTMDSHGNSLHSRVLDQSREKADSIVELL